MSRQKISLYIGGELADIPEQELVLYNYSVEDMKNPAAVKNSYSHTVTLPATQANNAIFGHYYRVDRKTVGSPASATGTAFEANRKTPFVIFADTGEILESGYIRLQQVVISGGIPQGYRVQLFGGLGELFYILTENENGDKLSLAGLPYLSGTEGELDFTINADAVRNAWARLASTGGAYPASGRRIWDVINFAPAYNGTPGGNFAADISIATAAACGLDEEVKKKERQGGEIVEKTYYAKDGILAIKSDDKLNEWACKDLRSYLQRPVISVEAVVEAIRAFAAARGKALTVTPAFAAQYRKLWLTLPGLPSIKGIYKQSGTLGYQFTTGQPVSGDNYRLDALLQVIEPVTTAMEVQAKIALALVVNAPAAAGWGNIFMSGRETWGGGLLLAVCETLLFAQVLALDDNDAVIGGGPVSLIIPDDARAEYVPKDAADKAGFTPWYGDSFESRPQKVTHAIENGPGSFDFPAVTLTASAVGATRFVVCLHAYTLVYYLLPDGTVNATNYSDTGVVPQMYVVASENVRPAVNPRSVAAGLSTTCEMTYTTSSEARSGAAITKGVLLDNSKTPADYLLSLAKVFGGVFLADSAAGSVTLMTRNEFYNTEAPEIDLTERVDISHGLTIKPPTSTAFLDFTAEPVPAALAEAYKQRYGRPYGAQRVVTGFEFDNEATEVMKSAVFRCAPVLLDSGPTWNVITQNNVFYPSIFVTGRHKATYYDEDGETYDVYISQPTTGAGISYYNNTARGYDMNGAAKLDFRGENGEAVEGADILCFFTGFANYSRFKISDDTAVMFSRAGKPCWSLDPGAGALSVPVFSGLVPSQGSTPAKLAYFGIPAVLDIPYLSPTDAANAQTFYARYWRAYMLDRYNRDTKVLQCRARLEGVQVGNELLRRLFWYEGSLWALNKISNFSLTSYNLADLELVQVHDVNSYTQGQIL